MKNLNKYQNEAKRWYDQSREDLKSAKILLENKRYYMVCFLSQQIAEKALKK
ncbi:MAG: HEPN domain-containing protein [Promethearchaeota archaeon]